MVKKKDIFYETKKKVIFICTSMVFLCLLIFAIITNTVYRSSIFNKIDRELISEIGKIEASFNAIGKVTTPMGNNIFFSPTIRPPFIIAIYKNSELEFLSPNNYFSISSMPGIKESKSKVVNELNLDGYIFRMTEVSKDDIRIVLLINVDSEEKSINELMKSLILSLILIIFIAALVSYFISTRVIKPLKNAYDKQVYFVQDASHEMRTPLAVIKGKLELLANSWEDTIGSHFEHISKMNSEIRRLEKLNGDLLLLTKEDINSNLELTKFNINKLLEDIESFYMDIAEVTSKKFSINNKYKNIVITSDYNKLKRVFIILLENAFKYTGEKGEITIDIEDNYKNVKVSIKDNGIGISKKDQERIFDRFFRSEEAREKNINGSGIGLSLLKSICNSLDIKVKVESVQGKGSEFILYLPR